MDVVEDIRTPPVFRTTARSMPASSMRSISRKSPMVCVTGFSVNTQGSLRDCRPGGYSMMMLSRTYSMGRSFQGTRLVRSDFDHVIIEYRAGRGTVNCGRP